VKTGRERKKPARNGSRSRAPGRFYLTTDGHFNPFGKSVWLIRGLEKKENSEEIPIERRKA
jgi:hypothetical protein